MATCMHMEFKLAELVVKVESDAVALGFPSDSPYRAFQAATGSHDLHLQVRIGELDNLITEGEYLSLRNESEELPPACRVFRLPHGGWSMDFRVRINGTVRRRAASFDRAFTRGELYIQAQDLTREPINPLASPLDRLLFVYLMAERTGMLLHAASVIDRGRGYLFVGPSGAGKTTLSRLWAQADGATVVGEECVAVRKKDDEFRLYGTPWIGESRLYANTSAPLSAIFFIYHADPHSIQPVSGVDAVQRLLSRSALLSYDTTVAERSVDFCLDLVNQVPTYLWGFVPDHTAIDLIRSLT